MQGGGECQLCQLATSWLESQLENNATEQEILRKLTDRFLEKCVDYVCEGIEDKATMSMVEPLKMATPMTNLGLVQQCCCLLAAILTEERAIVDEKTIPKRNDHAVQKLLDVKRQKAYTHLLPGNQPKQKSAKENIRSKISRYWWINSRKTYP